MLKSIKYELNPTNGQKQMLNQAFGNCLFVYNWALDKKIKAYQEDKKTLSCFDLMKELMMLLFCEAMVLKLAVKISINIRSKKYENRITFIRC